MYIASPIAIHKRKYSEESPPDIPLYIIKHPHINTPRIGNNGQNGTLNGLGLSGSVFININTSIHIITNYAKVP